MQLSIFTVILNNSLRRCVYVINKHIRGCVVMLPETGGKGRPHNKLKQNKRGQRSRQQMRDTSY